MIVFNQVTIIGVGLIGGSLALSARGKGVFKHITGIDIDQKNLRKAKELGAIDAFTFDLEEGVKDAELVVIATPVGVIVPLIKKMIPLLKKGTIITDVGSVKAEIIKQVGSLPLSTICFVGGHPIAGTENSGIGSAFADLFLGEKCILTPTQQTNPSALNKVKNLWEAIGSKVVMMDCDHHDKIFGAVSHLPHLIAFTLINYLNTINDPDESIFRFSAGGLKDFTRIAASHPVMWRDIALMNKNNLVDFIDGYQKSFEYLKELIINENSSQLLKELKKCREIRRNLI